MKHGGGSIMVWGLKSLRDLFIQSASAIFYPGQGCSGFRTYSGNTEHKALDGSNSKLWGGTLHKNVRIEIWHLKLNASDFIPNKIICHALRRTVHTRNPRNIEKLKLFCFVWFLGWKCLKLCVTTVNVCCIRQLSWSWNTRVHIFTVLLWLGFVINKCFITTVFVSV